MIYISVTSIGYRYHMILDMYIRPKIIQVIQVTHETGAVIPFAPMPRSPRPNLGEPWGALALQRIQY